MRVKISKKILYQVVCKTLKQRQKTDVISRHRNQVKVRSSHEDNVKARKQLYAIMRDKMPQISRKNNGRNPRQIMQQFTKLAIMDALGTYYNEDSDDPIVKQVGRVLRKGWQGSAKGGGKNRMSNQQSPEAKQQNDMTKDSIKAGQFNRDQTRQRSMVEQPAYRKRFGKRLDKQKKVRTNPQQSIEQRMKQINGILGQ